MIIITFIHFFLQPSVSFVGKKNKLTRAHTGKFFFFFLQNLLVCALFMLISFVKKNYQRVYGKFFNKKNLKKSSNDYMRPAIQVFLSFSYFTICVPYTSTVCASPYHFSFYFWTCCDIEKYLYGPKIPRDYTSNHFKSIM